MRKLKFKDELDRQLEEVKTKTKEIEKEKYNFSQRKTLEANDMSFK